MPVYVCRWPGISHAPIGKLAGTKLNDLHDIDFRMPEIAANARHQFIHRTCAPLKDLSKAFPGEDECPCHVELRISCAGHIHNIGKLVLLVGHAQDALADVEEGGDCGHSVPL